MVWYGVAWWYVVWYGMWCGMVVWHVVWYGVAWCGMVWFGMVLVVLCFMENRGLSESGPDESSGQNFWGKMHGIALRVWWDGWFVGGGAGITYSSHHTRHHTLHHILTVWLV